MKAATLILGCGLHCIVVFQSTPPVKAATEAGVQLFVSLIEISIHAAREGGDRLLRGHLATVKQFQSTPPVKAATNLKFQALCTSAFQSTPPVKAATRKLRDRRRAGRISIHAAREGGDLCKQPHIRGFRYFNPRRP